MKSFVNSLLAIALTQSTLFAADLPIEESLLSPEFLQWRKNKNTQKISPRSKDNRVSGIVPRPTNNLKFLKENPAKKSSSRSNLPYSFDLRGGNYVSPVKNQMQSGNCWAFTTMASLESSQLLDGSGLFDFSEKKLRNNHLHDNNPIDDGGNDEMSIAYFSRFAGPVLEEFDPYDDSNPTSDEAPLFGVVKKKIHFTDDVSIKDAIMSKGALFTAMCSDQTKYQSADESTTYYLEGRWQSNHAITLVGWDDTKVVPGAPGKGAWLVKNSWGKNWGDEGYFWLSYFDESSVEEAISFNSVDPIQNYSDIYYYDTLGNVANFGYGQDVAYAAVAVTPRRDEHIVAIGTYASAHNSSYKISVYETKEKQATSYYFSDLLYETEGSFGNCGYYVIDLPREIPVTESNSVYVVVEYTTPEFSMPIPFEKKIAEYSSRASANPEETFSSSNGFEFSDMVTTGSAAIKVLTSNGESPKPYTIFESNTQHAIKSTAIQFTDKSLNTPTQWEWDFQSDGVVDSDKKNPSFTYTQPGKYSVTLITSNASGKDTLVKENYISINDGSLTGDTVYISSDNSEAGYFPMTPFFENNWVSSIYSGEEVEKRDRVISGIEFHKITSTPAGQTNSSMKLFINHTNLECVNMQLSDTLTENCVYRGSFEIPANTGWTTVTFDEPFIYNGKDNIQITTLITGTWDYSLDHTLWEIIPTGFENYGSFEFFDNSEEEGGKLSTGKPAIRLISGNSGTAISKTPQRPSSALQFQDIGANHIQYSLPKSGNVKLSIFDMRGRELFSFSQGNLNAGTHVLSLDKLNLAKGIFLLQLQSGSEKFINRISIH